MFQIFGIEANQILMKKIHFNIFMLLMFWFDVERAAFTHFLCIL